MKKTIKVINFILWLIGFTVVTVGILTMIFDEPVPSKEASVKWQIERGIR